MEYYFNPYQTEVMMMGCKDTVTPAGRGVGKGAVHAWFNLRNFQYMPGCTVGIVAPFAKRAKTNTLPSMFEHWERWGFHQGIHWDIGKAPNKRLGWGMPLIPPADWENYITFYNGSCAQIISQDRAGSSNSKSYDALDLDEAKFIDHDKLKDETFPANRGQGQHFGHLPFHHGMLITSDMPVTKKGSWFLHYEKDCDQELMEMIRHLVAEECKLKAEMKNNPSAPAYFPRKLKEVQEYLVKFRRRGLFYKTFSSLSNLAILGEAWVKQMKRDLPPMVFNTSILCLKQDIVQNGFYSSMRPWHKYSAADFHYIDGLGYDFAKLAIKDCRMDADLRPDYPICVAFDFNTNINWCVVGQPDEGRKRMNTLKSFYVKYERKLPELVDDVCQYYEYFHLREVIIYYDSTALGSNYAVNDQDFLWVITHQFQLHKWICRPVPVGNPMNHGEKYLLINRGFAGQTRLTPFFNEDNNEDLLVSIQTAGVYNGKKDKRGEKLAETEEDKLESRTDGSDAWDTLYIGCERFPQTTILIPSSSTCR